jgi:hypothetical protein
MIDNMYGDGEEMRGLKGQGAGILVVILAAIFAAVGVNILGGINITGWSTINTTIYPYISTFILLGVLALAAFAYRYK